MYACMLRTLLKSSIFALQKRFPLNTGYRGLGVQLIKINFAAV